MGQYDDVPRLDLALVFLPKFTQLLKISGCFVWKFFPTDCQKNKQASEFCCFKSQKIRLLLFFLGSFFHGGPFSQSFFSLFFTFWWQRRDFDHKLGGRGGRLGGVGSGGSVGRHGRHEVGFITASAQTSKTKTGPTIKISSESFFSLFTTGTGDICRTVLPEKNLTKLCFDIL